MDSQSVEGQDANAFSSGYALDSILKTSEYTPVCTHLTQETQVLIPQHMLRGLSS